MLVSPLTPDPGAEPPLRLSALPVLGRITALNTELSGVHEFLPTGTELSFSKPIVLIYGRNNTGKSALLKMIHDSICFNNHFENDKHGWFLKEVLNDRYIREALREKSLTINSIANFVYTYRNDYALRQYLDLVEGGLGSRFNSLIKRHIAETESGTGKGVNLREALSTKQFLKLIELLKADTAVNRYFYFACEKNIPDSAIVDCLYQPPPEANRYARKTAGEKKMLGVFNRQYDGRMPMEKKGDIQNPFEVEMACIRGLNMRNMEAPDVVYRSDGLGAWNSWQLTQARIESIFEEQILRSLDEPLREFDKDVRLVVFLDEPDTFMDPPKVSALYQAISEMVERYKGRLQFLISTQNPTIGPILNEQAEFLDYVQKPACMTDSYQNIVW